MKVIQIAIILSFLTIILSKRIHVNEQIQQCIREKCPQQLKQCYDDMACQLQLNKCRQKIDKPQEQQQGNKRKPNQNVLSCLKKNKNSYNLIDCAYQNCENNSKSELYQYLLGKN